MIRISLRASWIRDIWIGCWRSRVRTRPWIRKAAEVAAIAAGVFAVLDPAASVRRRSKFERTARVGRFDFELETHCPSRSLELADATYRMIYDINVDGKNYRLELNRVDGRWEMPFDGREIADRCGAGET